MIDKEKKTPAGYGIYLKHLQRERYVEFAIHLRW